tara:strand:+ start:604 stop:2427 length:1824 start_codon:yes stop_codon:yes gene_type:complete
MAIEKTIIIDVDSKKATKDVEGLEKSVEGLNSALDETKKSEGNIEGVGDGAKKSSKGVKFLSKGFKGLGLAMKAAGIGLIISALTGLKEVFSQNQKVVDVFSTAFETFSIVANQVVTAVINVYESIAKSSENFNGLGKVLGGLITLGITPLKLGFFAIKLALQNAQLAWEESFFGDKDPETIKRLNEGIKETSKNIAEVAVDALNAGKDIATNLGDAVSEVANIGKVAGEELGKISIKNAKEQAKLNVELKNKAELAAVLNQGLIEDYDRQAELQRQIRDDESKGIEERIKANDKLATILDEQEVAMKSNAALAVQRAKVELDKNKDNIELQKAYQEALNEQAAIEAQITGFRSEQQTNTNSLLREQKELQNELALIGKSQRDIEREELAQELELKKELINREVTDVIERDALLLAAQTEFNTQLLTLNAEFDAEDLAAKTANDDAKKKIDEATKNAQLANAEAVGGAIGTLAGIAGEGTAAGKALGVASATIDTYVGANKAIAQGGIGGIASAIAIIATGLANVKTILSTKIPKTNVGSASVGGGASGGSIPAPPAFNVVGSSDSNQLADAIGGQAQQPVQAFVVANDVTTAQSLQNNIVEGATIG